MAVILFGWTAAARAEITSLTMSCSPCSAPPGGTFALTVNWCMSGANERPNLLVAFRPAPANPTIGACPAANQEFVIYPGSTGASHTDSPLNQGYANLPQSTVAGGCDSTVFTVTVPANLTPGANYYIDAAAGMW